MGVSQNISGLGPIEEYECDARDTKLGSEEITREIPNVSEESTKNLRSEEHTSELQSH